MNKLFGTDGIRGPVGVPPITPELILRLGHACGQVLKNHPDALGTRPSVLIGKDTRISGYLLESALEAGFVSAGVDVWLAGPIPTPAVAYLTRALRLSAGLVISASHNKYADNGVKIFSAGGVKLSDALEDEIEARMSSPMTCMPALQLGRARRLDDVSGRYIEFCKSTFKSSDNLRGMRVVVDSANGAAYQVAHRVFYELGAEVVNLGNTPDGLNINQDVGATHPEAMAKAVVANKADLGIALDGDGDRLIMSDHLGRIHDGDLLLWIMAMDCLQRGALPGVVGTLMSNAALETAFQKEGVPFARSRVGDRYVMEELLLRGWSLGGEKSGHLLNLECHTTGDGIISSLRVLGALQRNGETLAAAADKLPLFPQVLVNVPVDGHFRWQEHPVIVAVCGKVEEELHQQGRVLLRASGTESCLRIMIEGVDKNGIARQAAEIAEVVCVCASSSIP